MTNITKNFVLYFNTMSTDQIIQKVIRQADE